MAELVYAVAADAPAQVAWSLVSRPGRWHEWAPHVRSAWGLGDPVVREGARGAARLLGVVPVPALVTEVEPGRSWTWQVGPVRLVHAVEPDGPERCRVVFTVAGPAPVVRLYGPVVHLLMRNLARVAGNQAGSGAGT